jgi:hypothetical protein
LVPLTSVGVLPVVTKRDVDRLTSTDALICIDGSSERTLGRPQRRAIGDPDADPSIGAVEMRTA